MALGILIMVRSANTPKFYLLKGGYKGLGFWVLVSTYESSQTRPHANLDVDLGP